MYDKYQEIELSHYLSLKYRAGWRYLDNDRMIGTAFILDQRHETIEAGDYEYRQHSYTIALAAGCDTRPHIVCEAIHDTFGGSSCQCEHDCCGCWSYGVDDVEYMGEDTYSFTVSGSQNY